ncbi:MAG: menaquinone biosynthesis protein [Parafilimonas sp.]
MKKIKVGAVSYLNTKPLLYGIEHSEELMQQIELITDYPSKIAKQLLDGDIDIGLVPVAIIPQMQEYYIVSDYCIGAENNVASVCLFSDVALNEAEKILLDYQSKTSVALCKVLLKNHWKKNIVLEDAKQDFTEDIKGKVAGVLIGDRALQQRKKSKYIYDLADEWKAMTGLPFVFAAWISNKKLPNDFIQLFNQKNSEGVNNIDAVLKENECSYYDLQTYYTKNISYTLTAEKLKGMNLFLELMQQL